MNRIMFVGVIAMAFAGVAQSASTPYRYTVVRAESSGATAFFALNFARSQAAAICQSRFRGMLVGVPQSWVFKRGNMFSASVTVTCQFT